MAFTYQASANPMTERDIAESALTRRTGLGEFLGAVTRQAFFESLPGQALAQFRIPGGAPRFLEEALAQSSGMARMGYQAQEIRDAFENARMSEDEWRVSPHYREGLTWDESMTQERAIALANENDALRLRQIQIRNRDASLGDQVLAFGAALVGSAPDPLNFIPVAGPAARAAAIARLGRVGGRVAIGAAEGGLVTAAAQPVLIPSREMFGDQVTPQEVIMDIALSAAVGAVAGGAAGVLDRRNTTIRQRQAVYRNLDLETRAEAMRAASLAADQVARDAPIDVGAPSTTARAGVTRAVSRTVPEVRGRLPDRSTLRGQRQDPLAFTTGPETVQGQTFTRTPRTRRAEPEVATAREAEGRTTTPEEVAARTPESRQTTTRDNPSVGRIPEEDLPLPPAEQIAEADDAVVDAVLDTELARIQDAGRVTPEEARALELARMQEQNAANLNQAYDAAVVCLIRTA